MCPSIPRKRQISAKQKRKRDSSTARADPSQERRGRKTSARYARNDSLKVGRHAGTRTIAGGPCVSEGRHSGDRNAVNRSRDILSPSARSHFFPHKPSLASQKLDLFRREGHTSLRALQGQCRFAWPAPPPVRSCFSKRHGIRT